MHLQNYENLIIWSGIAPYFICVLLELYASELSSNFKYVEEFYVLCTEVKIIKKREKGWKGDAELVEVEEYAVSVLTFM